MSPNDTCRLMNSTKNKHWGHKLLYARCASVPPRQVIKTAIFTKWSRRLIRAALGGPGARRKRKTHTRTGRDRKSSHPRCACTSDVKSMYGDTFSNKGRQHWWARTHTRSRPIVRRILIVCRMHLRPPAHFICRGFLFFPSRFDHRLVIIACIYERQRGRCSSMARANGLENQNWADFGS